MFEDEPLQFSLPELKDNPLDDLYDQMEILGFTLSNPFDMVDDDSNQYILSKDLISHVGKNIICLAYFISHKYVITKNNGAMYFGTFVDKELNWINIFYL